MDSAPQFEFPPDYDFFAGFNSDSFQQPYSANPICDFNSTQNLAPLPSLSEPGHSNYNIGQQQSGAYQGCDFNAAPGFAMPQALQAQGLGMLQDPGTLYTQPNDYQQNNQYGLAQGNVQQYGTIYNQGALMNTHGPLQPPAPPVQKRKRAVRKSQPPAPTATPKFWSLAPSAHEALKQDAEVAKATFGASLQDIKTRGEKNDPMNDSTWYRGADEDLTVYSQRCHDIRLVQVHVLQHMVNELRSVTEAHHPGLKDLRLENEELQLQNRALREANAALTAQPTAPTMTTPAACTQIIDITTPAKRKAAHIDLTGTQFAPQTTGTNPGAPPPSPLASTAAPSPILGAANIICAECSEASAPPGIRFNNTGTAVKILFQERSKLSEPAKYMYGWEIYETGRQAGYNGATNPIPGKAARKRAKKSKDVAIANSARAPTAAAEITTEDNDEGRFEEDMAAETNDGGQFKERSWTEEVNEIAKGLQSGGEDDDMVSAEEQEARENLLC